jgi:hypothetical protein
MQLLAYLQLEGRPNSIVVKEAEELWMKAGENSVSKLQGAALSFGVRGPYRRNVLCLFQKPECQSNA